MVTWRPTCCLSVGFCWHWESCPRKPCALQVSPHLGEALRGKGSGLPMQALPTLLHQEPPGAAEGSPCPPWPDPSLCPCAGGDWAQQYSLLRVCPRRKCVSACPLGYFGDTAARRCRRCHKGCETCSGRGSTQCLTCRRGFYHHQEVNSCVTLCPAGFYAEESKCMSVPGPGIGVSPFGAGSPLLRELSTWGWGLLLGKLSLRGWGSLS